MRPSELFRTRPCDIERAGVFWFYRTLFHKAAHGGKAKSVPVLGDALQARVSYLSGDSEKPCFRTSKDSD